MLGLIKFTISHFSLFWLSQLSHDIEIYRFTNKKYDRFAWSHLDDWEQFRIISFIYIRTIRHIRYQVDVWMAKIKSWKLNQPDKLLHFKSPHLSRTSPAIHCISDRQKVVNEHAMLKATVDVVTSYSGALDVIMSMSYWLLSPFNFSPLLLLIYFYPNEHSSN